MLLAGALGNVPTVVSVGIAVYRDLEAEFGDQKKATLSRGANGTTSTVTEPDIAMLPVPVQRYLRASGCLGRPRPGVVRVVFDAVMMRKPGGAGMAGVAEQIDRFDVPKRLFYMRSRMFGLPVKVLHNYEGHHASMVVRVASLFNVVDIHSDELARTETVTLLNDLAFFAPAWLADRRLRWRPVDDRRVDLTFTNGPHTITASLWFGDAGELVNFTSEDRGALQADGSFKYVRWSTPMRAYREFGGQRVATEGDAIWHYPEGDFVYGRMKLKSYTVAR
jgi:hypothetical protein